MLASMGPVKKARFVRGVCECAGDFRADGARGDDIRVAVVAPVDVAGFRHELLAWYDANRRNLPWRTTSDPYAILVSEVMLQQTQVSRVEEYWPVFLDRFPTVETLAAATEDAVCAAWSGLGYYRRARNLREAARAIVADHAGELPGTVDRLRELPGVGAYTAAAVASIAFGEVAAVIDANVVRVLTRVLAEKGDPASGAAKRRIADEASRLLDTSRPGDFNQAVMELGAVVCTPTAPGCDDCPVAVFCCAFAEGISERFPATRVAARTVELREAAAIVIRRDRVLLTRSEHERGWWPGLWRLPRVLLGEDGSTGMELMELLGSEFGLTCAELSLLGTTGYSVTSHRVRQNVYRCLHPSGRLRTSSGARWFSIEDALAAGLPAADRRAIEAHGPLVIG